MNMMEEDSGKHVLAIGLVAFIGLAGMLVMFKESATGDATRLQVSSSVMIGCNDDEVLMNPRGIAALKKACNGCSVYDECHVNYNGVGYCVDKSCIDTYFPPRA